MTICTEKEAFKRGFQRYYNQRKFGRVYILPCMIGRKKLLAICTESEILKHNLDTRKMTLIFGDLPHDQENWESNHNDPVMMNAKRVSRYVKAMKIVTEMRGLHDPT